MRFNEARGTDDNLTPTLPFYPGSSQRSTSCTGMETRRPTGRLAARDWTEEHRVKEKL